MNGVAQIGFTRPVVELFTSIFYAILEGPPFFPSTDEYWKGNKAFLEWSEKPFWQAAFMGLVDESRRRLRETSTPDRLGLVRRICLNEQLASHLTDEYDSLGPESIDDRRGFLYAVALLIETHFGPIYVEAVTGYQPADTPVPLSLALDRERAECVIRSKAVNLSNRLFVSPTEKAPPQCVEDNALYELAKQFQILAPGGPCLVDIKQLNWLVLPQMLLSRASEPTLALVDILGVSAALDLELTKQIDRRFHIRGYKHGRADEIPSRVEQLFNYFDKADRMPTLLCLPELSAGKEAVAAVEANLRRRSRGKRVPQLTFLGLTHQPTGKGGGFHNEVRVFHGAQKLDVAFRKRKAYSFQDKDGHWMEGIDRAEELLLLDVPGIGRVTVAICLDFPEDGLVKTLFRLDVKLVLVPAMTTPGSVDFAFLPKAHALAGVGIATGFVNSGLHVDPNKHLSSPSVAGFFCPVVRQKIPEIQNHPYIPKNVYGAIYPLTYPFDRVHRFDL